MRTCERCHRELTFWNSGNGPLCTVCIGEDLREPEPLNQGPRTIAGRPLRCPHCQGDQFVTKDILLNTRVLTLFDLDWLNASADTHVCVECGHIQWFARPKPS